MKRIAFFLVLLLIAALLVACSGANSAEVSDGAAPVTAAQPLASAKAAGPQVDVQATAAQPGAALGETLVDEQGAVTVAVTPLNIDQTSASLDLEVAMDTHSVDRSMDLSTLATLTADTGAQVAARSWDAPRGGHHATGVLSFPAASAAGSLLEGATTLTLSLVNVDAPERTFAWSLQ